MGSLDVANLRATASLGSTGPPNNDPFKPTVQRALSHQCVGRAGSQRLRSTASMPSFARRRCAPSPQAARAPTHDHASDADRGASLLDHCTPAVAGILCRLRQRWLASMGAWRPQMNYHFNEVKEVRCRRDSSNWSPFGPICLLPSDHSRSIRAPRHRHSRRGALPRLPPDDPRPGRCPGRHRRHRRPLRRPRHPIPAGESRVQKTPHVRACDHMRGRCAAGCRRRRRRASRASPPRHPRLIPTRLPRCRSSQRRHSAVAERRSGRS